MRRQRWQLLAQITALTEKPLIALAMIWLVLVIVDITVGLSTPLLWVNYVIWGIFIVDFVMRLIIAPDRWRYLRSNWLTALSLAVPALRIFRALQFLRAARALRLARAAQVAGSRLYRCQHHNRPEQLWRSALVDRHDDHHDGNRLLAAHQRRPTALFYARAVRVCDLRLHHRNHRKHLHWSGRSDEQAQANVSDSGDRRGKPDQYGCCAPAVWGRGRVSQRLIRLRGRETGRTIIGWRWPSSRTCSSTRAVNETGVSSGWYHSGSP